MFSARDLVRLTTLTCGASPPQTVHCRPRGAAGTQHQRPRTSQRHFMCLQISNQADVIRISGAVVAEIDGVGGAERQHDFIGTHMGQHGLLVRHSYVQPKKAALVTQSAQAVAHNVRRDGDAFVAPVRQTGSQQGGSMHLRTDAVLNWPSDYPYPVLQDLCLQYILILTAR